MYRNLNTVIGGFRPLQTPLVGVLGSEVPSSGEGGRPGWLYTTVVDSGWASDRVAVWVESASLPGLFVEDNTAWTWSGLVDGTHTAIGRVYRNGVDQGTSTLTLTVGATIITATITVPESGDDVIAMSNVIAPADIPLTASIAMVETGDDVIASTVDVVTPVSGTVDVSMALVEASDDVPGMTAQVAGGGVQIPGPDPFPVIVWPDNSLGGNSPERRYKQPQETTDFDFDFSRWFARRTDEPLTATASLEPGTLFTLVNYWLLGQRIKVMLSGGVHNSRTKVTVRMTTTSGVVEEAECILIARET